MSDNDKLVILVRHGEKHEDNLTPSGITQIAKTVYNLMSLGYIPEAIYHSGANRTAQCAAICSSIIMRRERIGLGIKEPGLHYERAFQLAFGDDLSAFDAEIKAIVEAGGTVSDALKLSAYARIAREQLTKAIHRMANTRVSIGFTHSPLATLAVVGDDLTRCPYNVGEATAIIYKIRDGQIMPKTALLKI